MAAKYENRPVENHFSLSFSATVRSGSYSDMKLLTCVISAKQLTVSISAGLLGR